MRNFVAAISLIALSACATATQVPSMRPLTDAHVQTMGSTSVVVSENNTGVEKSWFYSDSHNDLPLMGKVTHPVAVDPDDKLRAHAESHGWPIISLRLG